MFSGSAELLLLVVAAAALLNEFSYVMVRYLGCIIDLIKRK